MLSCDSKDVVSRSRKVVILLCLTRVVLQLQDLSPVLIPQNTGVLQWYIQRKLEAEIHDL